jgi:hypothetical protein
MACRVENNTDTELLEGVAEIDVASRNTGLDFIAPHVAFKERTLAQLVKEIPDSSEGPVFSGNQMETM